MTFPVILLPKTWLMKPTKIKMVGLPSRSQVSPVWDSLVRIGLLMSEIPSRLGNFWDQGLKLMSLFFFIDMPTRFGTLNHRRLNQGLRDPFPRKLVYHHILISSANEQLFSFRLLSLSGLLFLKFLLKFLLFILLIKRGDGLIPHPHWDSDE